MNYEDITQELLLQRMLDRIPSNLDKRESSTLYNALAPASMELMEMYLELYRIMQETFADTASREYLILRASERGIKPFPATSAVLRGVFNTDVSIGDRFSLDDLNYIVIEKITTNEYKLKCETPGMVGNMRLGSIIPIEYIEGLESAELIDLLIPGEDEESTESLRIRYFDSLDSQAFGGNRADYKDKTNSIGGVGGTKVYRAWNGGGTVKLVIIDSQFKKPSEDLLTEVQTAIDPTVNQGDGLGIAPINHIVTIFGVDGSTVDITTDITYQSEYTWLDVKDNVEQAIDDYFLELNKTWSDNENLVVRISRIETRLLNITGILDIANTRINSLAENLVLDPDSIAVRGDVIG